MDGVHVLDMTGYIVTNTKIFVHTHGEMEQSSEGFIWMGCAVEPRPVSKLPLIVKWKSKKLISKKKPG